MKNSPINYNIITDAIDFYQEQGFEYIEVPWIISNKAIEKTTPPNKKQFSTFLGNLVASAEQSYIQIMLNENLPAGKYVACSPCFRDEDTIDKLHQNYFMKVELIDTNSHSSINSVLKPAKEFYSRYLEIDTLDLENQIDIISKKGKIELGSYGKREFEENGKRYEWIYGTGVAEPRLSQTIKSQGIGYHESPIPKSPYKAAEKILEETRELIDAKRSKNKIMEINELSDILGAIEGYLEDKFPNFTNEDLQIMSNTTKRAFLNGRR